MSTKSYEQYIEELDKITQKLEEEELPLNESLALFEKSKKLVAQCEKILEDAEKQVQNIEDISGSKPNKK